MNTAEAPAVPLQDRRSSALVVGLFAFLITPFFLTARGYLPPDDVLRHTAFAVGGRTWDQILVGRPEALFDQSPGWHFLLRGVHALTGWDPRALAVFSVIVLMWLFFGAALPWVRRWEAWALSLVILFLADPALLSRLTLGRPFLVSTAFALSVLGATRAPQERPWRSWEHAAWILGSALCTWIHGSWYLLFLIPLAMAIAGRLRDAVRLGCCVLSGVLVGALLTGHPVSFLAGHIAHLTHAFGRANSSAELVSEFKPGLQPILCLLIAALLGLANQRRLRASVPWSHPALVLGVVGWVLGHFFVWRFFLDWGFPALALWMAWQIDDLLDGYFDGGGTRIPLALVAASIFLATVTPNWNGRWSKDGEAGALHANNPAQAELLPEPGGVLYSNSMWVFYKNFFANPNGDWRYVLGYEPGLMLPEDYAVLQATRQEPAPYSVLMPWVDRMTPRDRLIIEGDPGKQPTLTQLEWAFSPPTYWVGRKR